ncbi:10833_t:CDS:2 [Dentiscutata erythropus]|uniref:10833_t:CDS:1 n=1 Tax=Dentiscutata erythropus TaxID=1348616 RepID=A0A9N9C060_9GLOM|nr:10833_t:CDS:2 [Dentiscutata erythropus]
MCSISSDWLEIVEYEMAAKTQQERHKANVICEENSTAPKEESSGNFQTPQRKLETIYSLRKQNHSQVSSLSQQGEGPLTLLFPPESI